MATFESKRQSDLEKRLKLLRQQVYGKLVKPEYQQARVSTSHTHQSSGIPIRRHTNTPKSDVAYLLQDLSKIGLLASLAMGIQLILLILNQKHILNLNFF